jgi:hypothetical protein
MKHERNHLCLSKGGTLLLHLKSPTEKARKIALDRVRFMIRNQVKATGLKNLRLGNTAIFASLEEDNPFLLEKVGGGSF